MPAVPAEATKNVEQAKADKAELLDINTATEAQLKALPGIGDAFAKELMAVPMLRKTSLYPKRLSLKPFMVKLRN
jgi:competence protein ComEA